MELPFTDGIAKMTADELRAELERLLPLCTERYAAAARGRCERIRLELAKREDWIWAQQQKDRN